jgi:hypothetical protein
MNTDPSMSEVAIPPGRALETFLEVTWGRTIKVWWSMVWRAALFAGIGGGLLGFVLGFIMGMAGASQELIGTVCFWVGVLFGIPIGIWVVRAVLKKSWSDFRIALVPKTSD